MLIAKSSFYKFQLQQIILSTNFWEHSKTAQIKHKSNMLGKTRKHSAGFQKTGELVNNG